MILEVAILDVKPALEAEFINAFKEAQEIIKRVDGYVSHEVQRCIENPHRFILLVNWGDLASHTINFRESAEYQEWKVMLHHFYDPFPVVEHYAEVEGLKGKN